MEHCRGPVMALIVLLGLFCAAHISESKQFTVQVQEPAQLGKVASALTQRGFYVKRINKRFSFVSFSTTPLPSADPVVSAAALDAASQATDCALIGDSPDNTPLYANSKTASKCAAGIQPTFPGAQPEQVTAAAAAASPVDAAIQSLTAEIPGVVVEEDPDVHLMRRLKQAEPAGVAAQPAADAATCTPGPDGAIGKTVEEAPYGIKMVQAVDPGMIDVSKQFRNKIMYCVIDTGVDVSNYEFSDNTIGCVPKTIRADGTNTSCKFPFSKDWSNHGTHTSGTIAAQRNGKGIVGVNAEGALLYHFNAFGPMGTFSMSEVIVAITDCVEELDNQRKLKSIPDMKLVVSMSFGAEGDTPLVRDAVKALARERYQDMLLVAAAGNGALEGAVYSYPAAWPEVVSVAAVDWAGKRAAFSQINDQNDWAAPGVQTLSTIPVAIAASTSYNAMPSFTVSPSSNSLNSLKTPAPRLLANSKTAKVAGQMVDCGLGKAACAGATGKICLIQRGDNPFCEKVTNCVAGGGIGAVIYGREDQDGCETFDGSLEGGCDKPAAGWPVAITVTKTQGKALQAQLAANPTFTATIDARKSPNPLPYEFMSGTSMATPTAAGVAGLVWSAHTECSGPELKAAVSWSAQDLGSAGYDQEFGHGLVQAAAAHAYLQSNPCSGTSTPSEPPRGARKQQPTDQPLRKLDISSDVSASARIRVGDTVKFNVKVTASAEGQQVENVAVRLRSKPEYSLACGSKAYVVTDATGAAGVTCTIVNPGNVSLEARIGNKEGGTLVLASSTVRVYRARQGSGASENAP